MTPQEIIERLIAEGVNPLVVFNHFETDGGEEIERDDEFAPEWFNDSHAVLIHRVICGCLCPENRDDQGYEDPQGIPMPSFYGGRTQMPFPTFSATLEDLE